jgi:hypothetical protein
MSSFAYRVVPSGGPVGWSRRVVLSGGPVGWSRRVVPSGGPVGQSSAAPRPARRGTIHAMTRDWQEWHRAYDDPTTALSARLVAVAGIIRDFLELAPQGPIRVLSLCAGEALDLATAAHGHPRAADLTGRIVEFDAALCATAERNLAQAALQLDVIRGDAADPINLRAGVPADLLLLCGIFGNISDDDIRTTIAVVPALCAPGATIVWTRHRRAPDVTPQIRDWFDTANCSSTCFVSEGTGRFAVGAERFDGTPTALLDPQTPLFTFRDDLW